LFKFHLHGFSDKKRYKSLPFVPDVKKSSLGKLEQQFSGIKKETAYGCLIREKKL
jgi:hypothetical protein